MNAHWVRVERDWSVQGVPGVVLASARLHVVVLPSMGGRIWQIRHLPTGTDLLWNNPRVPIAPVPFGASYDDNFLGGWDELFPNDLPEELAGEAYPDHGELWASAWQVEASGPEDGVRLTLNTRISAVRVSKTIRLVPESSAIVIDLELTNDTGVELPMMHKQHLALAVPPGSRIDLPSGPMLTGDFGNPRGGDVGPEFTWPHRGGEDLRPVPERQRRVCELFFATAPAAGWCALTRPDGVGIGLSYDVDFYRSCWTFASYGGWRDLDVVVLEPCTGYGLSVTEGLAAGTHRTLPAGAILRTRLAAVILEEYSSVGGITPDGDGFLVSGEVS